MKIFWFNTPYYYRVGDFIAYNNILYQKKSWWIFSVWVPIDTYNSEMNGVWRVNNLFEHGLEDESF